MISKLGFPRWVLFSGVEEAVKAATVGSVPRGDRSEAESLYCFCNGAIFTQKGIDQ